MFGHDVSFISFFMGKRGRDAAAAEYKPTGMDRSEGSLPEKSQSHGRKDLTFVRSFKVSQCDRHEMQDTKWEGFANRSTILPMNNLDGNMMKEDDAGMNGAELKKHVELDINYTATKVEHPLRTSSGSISYTKATTRATARTLTRTRQTSVLAVRSQWAHWHKQPSPILRQGQAVGS